MRMTLGRPYVH
uniref:Uncharacterized protein n=1 Tax=Rhizophora mucronata TaxID=61149 RepID=A0A2P2NEJ3_RHIMU